MEEPLFSLRISVDYPRKPGVLRDVRIDVLAGEILGLVGQSGSGKSTLALTALRLLGPGGVRVCGSIRLMGEELLEYSEDELRDIRGRLISLIPQSPLLALNPVLRIGTQLAEAWRAHNRTPWSAKVESVVQLMHTVGLSASDTILKRLPSQISVGQAQRVLLVMALLHSPRLLIADEPTSALDLITQREVIEVLRRIVTDRRMTMLFISHDLLTVAGLCDRLAILHEGTVVECGPVKEVFAAPRHCYTKQLISAATGLADLGRICR